jgi:hypothetical protein
MDSWNRTWGRSLLSRVPVEKTAIAAVAAVSVGIFAFSRARDAAPDDRAGRKLFERAEPSAAAPQAPQRSLLIFHRRKTPPLAPAPASGSAGDAGSAAPLPRLVVEDRGAAAGGPGWTPPRAPNFRAARLPGPDAAQGRPGQAAAGGQAQPLSGGAAPAARAAVMPARVSQADPARAQRSLRGLGAPGAAHGAVGDAAYRPGAEASGGSAASAGGSPAIAAAAGGSAAGSLPQAARDKRPGSDPDQVANTSPGTGAWSGASGLTKQEVAERREDLRLRAVCLREQCGRPLLGLAEAALKRRRTAAAAAAQSLADLSARLQQAPGLSPAMAATAASVAGPLSMPLGQANDAVGKLDSAVACLDSLRAQTLLPDDAAGADACHARALEALGELGEAAGQLASLRDSGGATLSALYAGASGRYAEAQAVQRLQSSYASQMGAALSGASGAANAPAPGELAQTRQSAAAMGPVVASARATAAGARDWSLRLTDPGQRQEVEEALDAAGASLADAGKQLAAAAADDAAASDAAVLTQASRDAAAALGAFKRADAPLARAQDSARGEVHTPLSVPSAACAALQ